MGDADFNAVQFYDVCHEIPEWSSEDPSRSSLPRLVAPLPSGSRHEPAMNRVTLLSGLT